ncbi:MAG: HAD family hydrolase [Candidatus Magasanikbacteria bacterium]|nr:HAD family hydrolase [Candidatus Magasanikbacteria bacterium]
MKKYILFDFDGVIVDSFDFSFRIQNKNRARISQDQYRKLFDGNIYDSVTKQPNDILSDSGVKDFFSKYEPELKRISCVPGMPEVIKDLSKDYEMIVVSSTLGNIIKDFLSQHNLQNYFAAIMGPEIESNKSKKIQMIFKDFNLTAHDCIFVTDTLGDIKEARVASVDSIAVAWGYHSLATLELGNPLAIADKPVDLPALIRIFLS